MELPGEIELLTESQLRQMTVAQLRAWIDSHGLSRKGAQRKDELIQIILAAQNDIISGLRELETILPSKHHQLVDQIINQANNREILPALYQISPQTDLSQLGVDFLKIALNNRYLFPETVFKTPVDLVMFAGDESLADDLLKFIGYPNQVVEILNWIEKINLLWWHLAITSRLVKLPDDFTIDLDQLRATYPDLSHLDNDQLIYLLFYRAWPPDVEVIPETLQQLPSYSSVDVSKISNYFLIDSSTLAVNQPISLWSPYQRFLANPINVLYPFVTAWGRRADLINSPENDPTELAEKLGLVFPPNLSLPEKIKYYLQNLPDYHQVLLRPDPIEPPPILEEYSLEEASQLVKFYGDDELLASYEVTFGNWFSREDFLNKLLNEAFGQPKWSFRNTKCDNPGENIMTLENRLVNNSIDPILSYGSLNIYSCYQMSELENSFREDPDDGFVFAVPDWTPESRLPREFPVGSILQLKRLLQDQPTNKYNFLIQQIETGLKSKQGIQGLIRQLRQKYLNFSPANQQVIQSYLVFLFVLGMYMRFWPGPGYPFPEKWKDFGTEKCQEPQRAINLTQQKAEHSSLLEMMTSPTREYISSLPRIRYDFQSGSVSLGREKINFIVELILAGKFCLAEGSDHLISTGYYLTTRVLNLNLAAFNKLLQEYLQNPNQPEFNPGIFSESGHLDTNYQLTDEN